MSRIPRTYEEQEQELCDLIERWLQSGDVSHAEVIEILAAEIEELEKVK